MENKYGVISNKLLITQCLSLFILFSFFSFVSASIDSDLTNNGMIVNVPVKDTKELKVNFVPVDFGPLSSQNFMTGAQRNIEFMNLTYPLAKNRFIPVISAEKNFNSSIGSTLDLDEQCPLLKELYKFGRLSGRDYDRVVGIVSNGWFTMHGSGTAGYSCPGLLGNVKAVLIEDNFRHGVAHEIGHTIGDFGGVLRKIGLCDEYNASIWAVQDTLFDRCPNGDSNPNDGQLDAECSDNPNGCITKTFGKLVPWVSSTDEVQLYNFMGDAGDEDSRWISNDSYNYLSNALESKNFVSSNQNVLISGIIHANNTIFFDKFYTLNETSFINETEPIGNYSVILKINDVTYYTHEFEPIFKIHNIDGGFEETNVTAFAFVLPFNETVTKIIIQNTTTQLAERNVSNNAPGVSFNMTFASSYNEDFMVKWNASDLDNDNLTYSVLISNDGGGNFTTLALDINKTEVIVENSLLENGSNFKVKVLVTDGVKTGSVISTTAFAVETDPIIELVDPDDNTVLPESNVTFRYITAVTNANITNCTLFINDKLNLTNSSAIVQGEVMNFTQRFADGNYNWTVQCIDTRAFIGKTETRDFSIGQVIPEIVNISVTPNPQGFGENVSLDVVPLYPNLVESVTLNITKPNGIVESYNVTNISAITWRLSNFTSFINGTYNFTFFVEHTNGLSARESGNFNILVDLITYCTELNITNLHYRLIKNISSAGTCLNITANNIMVDGNNYTINYAISMSGDGIYISGYNFTQIKNVTLIVNDSSRTDSKGVYTENSKNINITDTIIKTKCRTDISNVNCPGILISDTDNSIISKANINITAQGSNSISIIAVATNTNRNHKISNVTLFSDGGSSSGIVISGANGGIDEIVIEDSQIYSDDYYGIRINGGPEVLGKGNANITRVFATSRVLNRYALYLEDSEQSFIKDSNFSTDSDSDVKIGKGNHQFLNATYVDESVSTSANLTRKWYLNANVTNSSGTPIQDANVTGSNVTGAIQFSQLTDSGGKISRQELIEYINNAGTKTYYSNYTINATKSGYLDASQSVNLTTNKNLIFTLINSQLSDTNKFFIKNNSGDNVAWLGDAGNIVLKGSCFAQETCTTTDGNSFIIANSTDATVAFINSTGDLCIEEGDCSDQSATCNPSRDAFIIKNSTSSNMIYIDFSGDLCLTGTLTQNGNP